MKNFRKYTLCLVLLIIGINIGYSGGLIPSTNVNYQGEVIYNGAPANGDFQVTFSLFDTLTGGTAFSFDSKPITIVNGLINSEFNTFGASSAFERLWLEISIQDPLTLNNHILEPRIAINPAPYAIKSIEADYTDQAEFSFSVAGNSITNASVANGSLLGEDLTDFTISNSKIANQTIDFEKFATNGASDGDVVQYNSTSAEWESSALVTSTTPWNSNGSDINYTAGNVGIGISSPVATALLQLHGTADDELLLSGSSGAPVLHFRRTNGGSDWVLKNDAATSNFYFQRELVAGHEIMTLSPAGNVGIGTTSPVGILDVRNSADETLLNVNSNGSINRKTQTKTLTIGYQAFQTEEYHELHKVSSNGTITGIENTYNATVISLYAPIFLPDNAKIIKYELLAFDNDPTNFVTSRLKTTNFSTNNVSSTLMVMNTGNIPGGIVVTDNSINHNYQSDRVYYAFITLPPNSLASTQLLFAGVRVTYEIDEL